MWRLVISQKKYTRYIVEGMEKEMATTETTVFESEDLNALLIVVSKLSTFEPETETEYTIQKIKEEEK